MKGLFGRTTAEPRTHYKEIGKNNRVLLELNYSFPRKKSAAQYSYFAGNGSSEFNEEPSPLRAVLQLLRSSFSTIKSTPTGCSWSMIVIVERSLRNLLRLFNDRISQVWNVKDRVLAVRHITLLLLELDEFADILESTEAKEAMLFVERPALISLVSATVRDFVPAMQQRLYGLCTLLAQRMAADALRNYLHNRQKEFLVIWSDRRNTHSLFQQTCSARSSGSRKTGGGDDETIITSSLWNGSCIPRFWKCGSSGRHVDAVSVPAQSEKQLYDVLLQNAIQCLVDASFAVHKSYQLHYRSSQQVLDDVAAGSSLASHSRYASIASITINAALSGLLDIILELGLPFDEAGIYKLFRIVLKLQEFVALVKKTVIEDGASSSANRNSDSDSTDIHEHHNSNTDLSSFKLIADTAPWKRAELVLCTLNETVFAVKRKLNSTKPHHSQGAQGIEEVVEQNSDRDGESSYCTFTEEERQQWVRLATRRSKSGSVHIINSLRYWRKRHKGTVFVSLQINVSNL